MANETSTFVFADLARFTALTAAHGDEAAADIAADFTSRVRRILGAFDAREVKTIGDEVMIRVGRSDEAVSLALRVVGELARHGAPPVRVGMHTGHAVERDRDYFGGAVNLASRVAGAARAGEVLLTEATREALGDPAAFVLQDRGRRYFKNVPEPICVYAAHDDTVGEELEIDPVCGMAVSRERSGSTSTHRGRVYHFCSEECLERFESQTSRYVLRSRRARAARSSFIAHARVFAIAQFIFFLAWAVPWALGGPAFPWFAFVLLGWGIPLGLHYRAVRAFL